MSEVEGIEIGLCVLDVPTLARVEQRDIIVRPVCSTIGRYCKHMTTLTQADVDGGVPLAEACRILAQEYQSPVRLWASYGDYDRKQFERNCGQFGIPYPFGPTRLNVKTLAAVAHGWSREVGMQETTLYVSEALNRMGLPLEGAHHRGGDDAWNHVLSEVEGIAAILSRVLGSSRVGCVELGSRA